MKKEYKMSAERKEELQNELTYLKTVREQEVADLIKEARGFGDLSENSEYDEAKNEQGKLYSRIAEVEDILLHAVIVDESDAGTNAVGIGCRVTVADVKTGREMPEYKVVGSQEADPMHHAISEDSPFGKALMGAKEGDEVSVDAARWYFNAKPDTQMEFDLGLAVREDSENPIYYVEYAHARICSLLRALAEEGTSVPRQADVDMSLLSGEAERALLKQIAQFCEEIKLAARDYDPSHINRYLQELAACFHRFYTACRIKGEESAVRDARLKLADDTRIVLRNGLKLIGVDAPEKM